MGKSAPARVRMTLRRMAIVPVVIFAACTSNPQEIAQRAVGVGDKYFSDQKYAEAVVEYRRALKEEPQSGGVRLKLARSYLATGNARNGYQELLRAADLLPEDTSLQLEAGQVLLLTGQFDLVRRRATRLLADNPKSIEAQILLGNALAGLKDLDGAIQQVEEAIDADPRRTLSYTNLGLLEMAKGNKKASEDAFKRAVTLAPDSGPAHLSLGNYYWAAGQPADAERELKTALKISPESGLANRALAAFYVAVRRPNDAEPYLKAYVAGTAGSGPKFVLADFYISNRRTADARAVLDSIVSSRQDVVPAKLRIAGIEYSEGRRAEAHRIVDDLLQRDQKNESARLVRARFLFDEAKHLDALKEARTVIAKDPASLPAQFLAGASLAASGSVDEAINAFQEVIRLDSRVAEAHVHLARLYLTKGDGERAAQSAQQAVKLQPESAFARLLLAKAHTGGGNLESAETELATLSKTLPSSAPVQAALGSVFLAKQDRVQARRAYVRALELDASSLEGLAGLTQLDLSEKKFSDARARLERQLVATPEDARVLLLAGSTFLVIGEPRRAESTLKKAIQIDPASMGAYDQLARLYVSEQRLDDARREFEALVLRDPKSVAAATMVGMLCELQRRPGEARKHYERALTIDAEAPIAANNLAWTYAVAGENLDAALKLAQIAKAKMPGRHEVDDTLGWIYYKIGIPTLAIASLKQGVTAQPNNPVYLFHLGLAYAQRGDNDEARRVLDRALKLQGNFDGADEARRVLTSIQG